MKKYYSVLVLLLAFKVAICQSIKKSVNKIEVSTPIVWNNSNGIYYSLGNKQKPMGKSVSYGLDVNYIRTIYKGIFIKPGIGYFKQSFNINRPFSFDGDTITKLLYYTKNYKYDCIRLSIGIGKIFSIKKKLSITSLVSVNLLNTVRQTYKPDRFSGLEHKKKQINNKKFVIGSNINLIGGIGYRVSKKIGIGTEIIFPMNTKWKDDKIFKNNYYANDSQIIAETNSTIGTTLNLTYHF